MRLTKKENNNRIEKKIAKQKAIQSKQLEENLPEHAKNTGKIIESLKTHLK